MTTKEEQYRQALEKIRATLLDALRLDAPGVDPSTPELAEMVAERMQEWWNSPARKHSNADPETVAFIRAVRAMRLVVDPEQYMVVRTYYDGSGVMATYGPVGSKEAGAELAAALSAVGVGDLLTAYPHYAVRTDGEDQ